MSTPSDMHDDPSDQTDHADTPFYVTDEGVFYCDPGKPNALPVKVCSPLTILAKTRDSASGEWGRLLSWIDDDGHPHEWVVPLAKLEGDGLEVRQELARGGLHIGQQRQARELLSQYIKSFPVSERVLCVDSMGWHGDTYVTAQGVIGNSAMPVVYQGPKSHEPVLSRQGTAQQWRDSVGRMAVGNSRLIFAVCIGLAAPVLKLVEEPSGGFHFRGASSTGKSTALKMAASVWGSPNQFVKTWRSTLNGLESLAVRHNDGLLILDEIGQMNPAEAGEAAYLIANGQGKARANRNGMAAKANNWRVALLSAGEESLSTLMSQAGKRISVGQDIRLADIEADAGCSMGIVENVHGSPSSGAFIANVLEACNSQFGCLGQDWLMLLAVNKDAFTDHLGRQSRAMTADWLPVHASGQVSRVARRFALVGLVGELASEHGLTGWPAGEALQAARRCFDAWLDGYGGLGNREDELIFEHVLTLLNTHGSSRFQPLSDRFGRVPNRLGFTRTGADGSLEFLIPTVTFKAEFCRGFDAKQLVRVLKERGLLVPSVHANQQTVRIPDIGSAKVYVLRCNPMETPDSKAA